MYSNTPPRKRAASPLNAIKRHVSLVAVACAILATPALAVETHVPPMTEFAENTARAWVADPLVIAAVRAQNAKHAELSQAEIDSLDKQWRAETKTSQRPLINRVLSTELSKRLVGIKNEGRGLITELFVMDNKGLNVGQSDVTSDYWQGDEAKWQKTYLAGPGAVFIDDVEMDESTQTFQSQLSLPIVDPQTGEVIGALTAGIDVDQLL